jgi:gliding motility-associated-like protein
LYQWTTPCNTGYVLVYDQDSILIREHPVGCASKTKLSLPLGLKGDWSNGVNNANYINVTEPGLYWAEINGCFRDSIWSEIIFNQLDLGFHLMPDQDTVLFSTNLTVTAEAIPGTNISWYRDGYGIQGYNGPGLYTCIATLEECREYDTLLVIPHLFQGCDWPVYKPNAFSPNNDGVNDLFRVFGPDGSISHIWVYNRWGGLLYSGQAWDGTCGSKELEPGVYTFRAKVVWGFEECSSVCGDITLIR